MLAYLIRTPYTCKVLLTTMLSSCFPLLTSGTSRRWSRFVHVHLKTSGGPWRKAEIVYSSRSFDDLILISYYCNSNTYIVGNGLDKAPQEPLYV